MPEARTKYDRTGGNLTFPRFESNLLSVWQSILDILQPLAMVIKELFSADRG